MVMLLILGCSTMDTPPPPADQTKRSDEPIQLWFGGDLHVSTARKERLDKVIEVVPGGIGFINLEGPVGIGPSTKRVDGKWVLRNTHSLPMALKDWKIGAVSTANNHRLDAGEEGVAQTLAQLERSAIMVATPTRTARLEIGNKRISMMAADLSLLPVTEAFVERLESERALSDILIVSYHTGEDTNLPSPHLETGISEAVNANTDIVVAHGSHRLGPVRRMGKSIVASGLGNLLFDCDCTHQSEAMVLQITIDANGEISPMILPITAGLKGGNAQPATEDGGILNFIEALGDTPITRIGWKGSF